MKTTQVKTGCCGCGFDISPWEKLPHSEMDVRHRIHYRTITFPWGKERYEFCSGYCAEEYLEAHNMYDWKRHEENEKAWWEGRVPV